MYTRTRFYSEVHKGDTHLANTFRSPYLLCKILKTADELIPVNSAISSIAYLVSFSTVFITAAISFSPPKGFPGRRELIFQHTPDILKIAHTSSNWIIRQLYPDPL